MRILLVHPGASTSTSDVYAGLYAGLKAMGHEVLEYPLDDRISAAGGFLHWLWKRRKIEVDKPTVAQILYRAGAELLERALRVEPDVVLAVSAMYLHPDVLVLMRRAGLKVAVLLTESPYDEEKEARLLPFVQCAWTNERSTARRLGIHYLKHAWNPTVHNAAAPVGEAVPAHDVVFVGTNFAERVEILANTDWTGIDLGLYGNWESLGSRHPLRKYIRGRQIENAYAVELYRRAKIGLNLYRTSKGFGKDAPRVTGAESMNPRAYELATLGCFTISDRRPEVEECFGDLVPTFRTHRELRPLIDRWLADEAGRANIQAALPGAVAMETWIARAQQVTDNLADAGIVARREQPTVQAGVPQAVGG